MRKILIGSGIVVVIMGVFWAEVFAGKTEINIAVSDKQIINAAPTSAKQSPGEIKPEKTKEWKDFAKEKEGEEEEEKGEKKEEKEKGEEKDKEKKGEKEKELECPKCGEKFLTGRELGMHMKEAHKGLEIEKVDGNIGAANLNGIIYYRIVVQPVCRIGKFKFALNLNLTWNDTSGLKPWTPEDWLNLILYLQWAEKGERPIYWRFGSLERATLGQGFIVNRYSNLTPKASSSGYRNLGIEFDLDFDRFGFESLLNNVLQPGLIGVRGFWRPFSGTFFENFTTGLTYATDINTGPIAGNPPAQEPITNIAGLDIGLPLVGKFLVWFADGAWIINHGNGWASGFKGEISPVSYKLEYRNLDSDFISGYFNNYYEFSKPVTLPAHTGMRSNGWCGEITANILKFVTLNIYYEDAKDNAGNTKQGCPWIHTGLSLNPDLFTALTGQKISFSASYDQKDLFDPNTSQTGILEGRILYGLSKNADIAYIYTQRYVSGQPVVTSSLQTQIHF